MEDFQRNLSTTKMQLLQFKSLGFFASLLFNLKIIPEDTIETISTNGIDIFINPDWFVSQDKDVKVHSLLQATLHVALQHPGRMQNRQKDLWQAASDYSVNLALSDYSITIPQGSLLNQKYRNVTTEKIYEHLLEQQEDGEQPPEPDHQDLQPPPIAPNNSQGNSDSEGEQQPGESPESQFESMEDFQNKLDDLTNQAKVQAKLGDNYDPDGLPHEMQKLLAALEKPLLPWNTILQRFLNSVSKNAHNWMKPNRRFFPEYILPSMHSEGLDRIDFIIDTSGSISDNEFTQFMSEVDKVLKQFKPEQIGVSQFDHIYHGTDIVSSTTDIRKLKFKGGGGTNIKTTLEEVAKMPTKCMVIFTDGYMNLHLKKPKIPVVWAIYGNDKFEAPFGKVIHFKLKDIM